MPYALSRTRKAHLIPEDVSAKTKWGRSFSREHGFAFIIHKKYWMSVFVHKDLLSKNASIKRKALAKPGVIAHCISCVGEDWEVHAEPTDKLTAGFIVYTAKKKPIGRGVIGIDDSGALIFTSQALYPGITNAVKFDYKVEGKAKDNGWEIGASVTVSDSR